MPHSIRSQGATQSISLVVLLSISLTVNGLAQDVGSHPIVDSAAVARQRYQEALAQFRGGDQRAGLATALSAASAWPSQPAYHSLVATMAARIGDTTAAVQALDRLAALGARHPVERDPAFDAIRASPAVLRAVRQMADATRPEPRSSLGAAFGPAEFFAEGLAVGPDGTVYIGSIHHRRVLGQSPDGQVAELVGDPDSVWAISGLAVAADSRSLWLTSNAIPQMQGYDSTLDGRAELVQVALADGRVLARIPVGHDRGGAMLGDLVLAGDGTLYASDTRGQALWRVRPGAREAVLLATHPLLRSPQGMVLTADGTGLLVADYSHGLLRVELTTGAVVALEVPQGMTVLGIDGLARHGRDLIAIQNGGVVPRVVRIRMDAHESHVLSLDVLDRNTGVADEPTLGVVAGDDYLYVANSQWEKRGEDGTPLPGAKLTPTMILRLPLGPPTP